MGLQNRKSRPGYQGTHTASVEVSVYSHGDDPVLSGKRDEVIHFRGRNERDDTAAVMSLSTDKTLGAAAGNFVIELKDPGDLIERIADDDWIDITVNINGNRFHVMRGLVESFRSSEQTGPSGTTVRTLQIEGRDFGVVFEKTKIWFNQFRAENTGFQQTINIFKALNEAGNPAKCVERVLFGFLETMATAKPPRANWVLPRSMPGHQRTFPESVYYFSSGFREDRDARRAVDQQLMDPSGQGVWSLAQEWSDPQLCELFCDLLDTRGQKYSPEEAEVEDILRASGRVEVTKDEFVGILPLQPGRAYGVEDTMMGVIFRDRPFPTERDGEDSPWFKLPLALVAHQDITSNNVGRGGAERYNAFFAAPRALAQLNANKLDLVGPLWDTDSVNRHGLRDFAVDSRYIAAESNLLTLSQAMRRTVRDFHCLNPYFLNGTISLGVLRPDIRVGMRVRVFGVSPNEDVTYYVESVAHQWRLGGGRTSLGVTRGWRGTDDSLLRALRRTAARYTILPGNDREPVQDLGEGILV